MWLWAWFTGGGWILVAGGAVVLGLVAAAVVVGATARARDYPGRHVLADFVEVGPPGQDFYGSMSLDDERAIGCNPLCASYQDGRCDELCRPGQYPDPIPGEPDWREQTAADLSPEALAIDSGPGLPSLVPPGPDLAPVLDLGPNARRVLERYERRFTERWSLTWDNEAVAA